MTTFVKYTLLQIPGWAIMALLLVGLLNWVTLPLWAAGALFVIWVLKDFLLYPFVRAAYDSNVKTGSEQLVGALGVAHGRLAPHGYVHVHGELWQATAEPKNTPIAPGTPVRVRGAQGLTLVVTADAREDTPTVPPSHSAS
jgi:membrane protein implicated in regulation of membrane protease activity